jgi:hypothetical protein
MKDSPPEGPGELRQQADKSLNSLRVSNFKFIIALYLIILSLLTIVLHTGFNPMPRPLVDLLWIVGSVSLFLRSQTTRNPSGPLDLSNQTQGALAESAKKVYDLKDIPPELADNPGVQKLFEWAGGQSGWLKIGPRSQFTDQESQGAETVKIGVGLADPHICKWASSSRPATSATSAGSRTGRSFRLNWRPVPTFKNCPDLLNLTPFCRAISIECRNSGRLCLRS